MFTKELPRFLSQLKKNNRRPWFQQNKARYEEHVLGPALAFVAEMAPRLRKISPQLSAEAKKMGGAVMRIYRDTRFSKDKSPYKTNVGIQFRHRRGKDVHAPGLYVHLDPGECFLGAGTWHPDPEFLAKIRAHIVKKPNDWAKVRRDKKLWKTWKKLVGDSLQRPPRGFDDDHPHIDDLKRKDFIAVVNFKMSDALKKNFADKCAKDFAASKPLMKFLCRSSGLTY